MTPEGVAAEEHDVNRQDDRAEADAERTLSSRWISEPHRFPDINREDDDEDERKIKKVAVHVLHDQGERAFAEIRLARFADRASGRVGPETFVIGAAVVITGEAKTAGRPQDQKRRRKQKPRRPPSRFGAEPTVG